MKVILSRIKVVNNVYLIAYVAASISHVVQAIATNTSICTHNYFNTTPCTLLAIYFTVQSKMGSTSK